MCLRVEQTGAPYATQGELVYTNLFVIFDLCEYFLLLVIEYGLEQCNNIKSLVTYCY